jgi:hypothetical protein
MANEQLNYYYFINPFKRSHGKIEKDAVLQTFIGWKQSSGSE